MNEYTSDYFKDRFANSVAAQTGKDVKDIRKILIPFVFDLLDKWIEMGQMDDGMEWDEEKKRTYIVEDFPEDFKSHLRNVKEWDITEIEEKNMDKFFEILGNFIWETERGKLEEVKEVFGGMDS